MSRRTSTWRALGKPRAVGDVEVANHSLTAFVDEERIAEDASAIDGSVARQNLRIDVAQNHLGRTGIVPGKQARPDLRLVFEQGTQIHGRKVPEVENLQGAPAARVAARPTLQQNSECRWFEVQRQTTRTSADNKVGQSSFLPHSVI